MAWEYRFITIAVSSPHGQAEQTGSNANRKFSKAKGEPNRNQEQTLPPMSQAYRDLEFPAYYRDDRKLAGKATRIDHSTATRRAKQVERVVNGLAAEGWDYVGLDLLLGEQVLVMRRARKEKLDSNQAAEIPQPHQPWWRLSWRKIAKRPHGQKNINEITED